MSRDTNISTKHHSHGSSEFGDRAQSPDDMPHLCVRFEKLTESFTPPQYPLPTSRLNCSSHPRAAGARRVSACNRPQRLCTKIAAAPNNKWSLLGRGRPVGACCRSLLSHTPYPSHEQRQSSCRDGGRPAAPPFTHSAALSGTQPRWREARSPAIHAPVPRPGPTQPYLVGAPPSEPMATRANLEA